MRTNLVKQTRMNVLARSFSISMNLKYKINIAGLENFSNKPSTLVVCNHVSEGDPFIIIPTIYFNKGNNRTDLYFVTREDYFKEGFPLYQKDFGHFRGAVLFHVNHFGLFSRIMRSLNARPVRKYDMMTAREHLTEIIENIKKDNTLSKKQIKEKIIKIKLEEIIENDILDKYKLKKIKFNKLLGVRYNYFLKNIFQLPYFIKDRELYKIMKDRYKETVAKQIEGFSRLLDEGKTLLLFPEGYVNYKDGLARIRQGYNKIIVGTKEETQVTVLPIHIEYIPQKRGRTILNVNIGKEFIADKSYDMASLNSDLEEKLINCYN